MGGPGFGFLNQGNDLLILTIGGSLGGLDGQRRVAVDGPGHHVVTGAPVDRPGFTGQGRLIQSGFAVQDDPINRDHFTRLDQQVVINVDVFNGDISQFVAVEAVRGGRGIIQQAL